MKRYPLCAMSIVLMRAEPAFGRIFREFCEFRKKEFPCQRVIYISTAAECRVRL